MDIWIPGLVKEWPVSIAHESFTAEQWGHDTIGGRKMFWVCGKEERDKGQPNNVQVGFVVLPGGKTVMYEIYESRKGDQKYDPAVPKPFLDRIKGF